MRLSHFAPKLGLVLMLSAGCSDGLMGSGTDDKSDQIKGCTKSDPDCTDSNGPNPWWTPFDASSSYYMTRPEWPAGAAYEVTGFVEGPSRDWIVRGYHVAPGLKNPTYTNYDGKVNLRTADSKTHRIVGMRAQSKISTWSITYCVDSACDTENTVTGDELTALSLKLGIPGPGGRGLYEFNWTFKETFVSPSVPAKADKWKDDTTLGVMVFWSTDKDLNLTALCRGAGNTPQLIVPIDGAMWDPTTFARIPNDRSVTIACETGAIAECTGWGYTPAFTAKLLGGGPADMVYERDSCIQMKTANYCGDGAIHTKPGTLITISDPLDPSRRRDYGKSEAIWSDTGAFCVDPNTLRHPEIALGCGVPTCQPKDWPEVVDYYFISGIPK